jgi:hypothetical protein
MRYYVKDALLSRAEMFKLFKMASLTLSRIYIHEVERMILEYRGIDLSNVCDTPPPFRAVYYGAIISNKQRRESVLILPPQTINVYILKRYCGSS